MAMTADSLKSRIQAKIEALGGTLSDQALAVWAAVAAAVVEEIQGNAEIQASGAVATGIPVTVTIPGGTGTTTAPGNVQAPAGSIR